MRMVALRFGEAELVGSAFPRGPWEQVRPDKFYEIMDSTSESTSETLTWERSEWAARN